jgi:hypothetical protein
MEEAIHKCARTTCPCKQEKDSLYCCEECATAGDPADCSCQHEICKQARGMGLRKDDPLLHQA